MNRKLFRPTLTEMKEPHTNSSRPHSTTSGPQPHKKPAPRRQSRRMLRTSYWIKQMQARTAVVIVMADGETLHGSVEWYDRDCVKLTRNGSPNLLDL